MVRCTRPLEGVPVLLAPNLFCALAAFPSVLLVAPTGTGMFGGQGERQRGQNESNTNHELG